PVKETLLKAENGTHFLLDLGREDVGFLYLSLASEKAQTITVAYGEHIIDGGVRRKIGNRDFSVEYTAAPGENEFLNTYRRFGLRYLELFCEAPIALHRATIRPTLYPVTELPFDAGNPTRQAIYDTCVRTLRLCMHEHYEDCPWREQGLYAMDSRNQMLTGYDTFGETRFARAALALIAQDRRPDGLLSIAYPGGWDQPIPSFSLHYFTEVREYTEFSGDTTLAAENWDKLCDILNTFLRRVKNGLIDTFTGPKDWNFYEWAPGLEGRYKSTEETHCDVVLNALLILAIESMKTLSSMTGKPLAFDADETLAEMRSAAEAAFGADSSIPAYPNVVGEDGYSELGNGLAVMAGIMPADRARAVFDAIADGTSTLTPITLSMKCFLYDAMLAFDKEAYAPYILADIDKTYGAMLDAGATSFWETEKGAEAFGGAGSLCHGWSAMPAYYYHRLLK
ncbi:MAG: family 78 glycoside hydrolase catalytic domain, partial [Clostridia bacterium]|nr:family 78 glycoside hydrolase catalytic domain [Clostridia bacterium]